MAGADAACVPARAGTILGIARSGAHPAVRKVEQFEPWLRLAVPTFLALFLTTLAAGAWLQTRDAKQDALVQAIAEIDVLASLAAARLGAHAGPFDATTSATHVWSLARELPAGALARGRRVYLADGVGDVQAVYPASDKQARSFSELFGETQPLTILADRAGVMTVSLAKGDQAIATVRNLPNSPAQIAIIQPIQHALAAWRSRAFAQIMLLAGAVVVIAGLGAA